MLRVRRMAGLLPLAGVLTAALSLSLFQSCKTQSDAVAASSRGRDPWVFRSVLDQKPRMVTLALRPDFWAAYDAGTGAIYKVWRDGVLLDGPVYTTNHGPQPAAKGPAWLIAPEGLPWRVIAGADTLTPQLRYLGHVFDEQGHVSLNYELKLPSGERIQVSERPEYVRNSQAQPGLERVFTVSGAPAGTQVALRMHLNSLPSAGSYETDGTFTVTSQASGTIPGSQYYTADGLLLLKPAGSTAFTAWFTREPAVIPQADESSLAQHPGLALIQRSDCQACHNPEVQTVGPSYQAIAAKYPFTSLTVQQLATKIVQGGSGVWGQAAMTAHPDLQMADAMEMVQYILAMDGEALQSGTASSPSGQLSAPGSVTESGKGLAVNVYVFDKPVSKLADVPKEKVLVYSGTVNQVNVYGPDFSPLTENFFIEVSGYLTIPADGNYVLRLISDDGSRLTLDGKELILNDGLHGLDPKDAEVQLKAGKYPLSVGYFQAGGGAGLSLQWAKYGDADFSVIPEEALSFDVADLKQVERIPLPNELVRGIPGDGLPLRAVHPSFDLSQARPSTFEPKVGGMDFLPDGRLVVSTWDPDGSVYVLSNVVNSTDPEAIQVKRIAAGLAEPLGLKVVDGQIYVLQKQELTQLIDRNGDGITDEYRSVCNGWRASANFHEFAFGLAYQDGFFYGTLATAINPGGASTQPQIPDRGKVVKISKETGEFEFVASGLRTPNGIGQGVDGQLFVADNQGDWLPSSKIVHVKPGAFYGSRSVDFAGTANTPATQPVVWLPQDEIGNSPSQPIYLDQGPYKGQMLHGEVTHGGLKRVFAEQVDGEYQGAVFRFTQGLEAGVNRVAWGPDGALYIGGVGNPGNWGHAGGKWFGLQRLKYNGSSTFEMLAVRARSNGIEIEFTEPLQPGDGYDPAAYLVRQWRYVPNEQYGGPKVDDTRLPIRSVRVSEDRRRVFLELQGMKPGHVVYLRLLDHFVSAQNHELWSTEAWYTMNRIPQNQPGFAAAPAEARKDNQLSSAEQAAGWRLLFDGKTLDGWHIYRKGKPGAAWRIENGTLAFAGGRDGGDLVTDESFENYELTLEWKIAEGGNSGIIYNVIESDAYDYVWQTGPEMQILDNERHPDRMYEKHRAGDLYDLIACKYVTVNPAGQWNRIRLIVNRGQVEHWQNGHQVVKYDMNSPEWPALIAGSKFKDMPGFGKSPQGRIALQDHGDKVWFRNIKIRPLSGQ
ncbi:MAG: family 16 glycoside hydrolase [Bacteroidia bacterium]|nr:family 16 glycoside hydrolase [Bacteroidia bacterium]